MSSAIKRPAMEDDHGGRESGPKRALSSGGSFFVNPALRLAAEGRVGEAAASGPAMQVEGTLQPAPEGLRYTARRGSHVEFLEVKAPGMEKQTTFVETDVVDDTREIHSLTLSAVTTDRLINLFVRLDKDGSGSLEVSDFETGVAAGDEANAAVWRWIQEFFSGEAKSQISLRDFINGWKDKLWAEVLRVTEETPWEPDSYSTLNELVARLNDSFDDTAAVRLTEIEQTLSDNLYPTLRDDDSRFSADYRAELLGNEEIDYLFVITMTDVVLKDLKSLWKAFDKTDDMRITLADLRRTLGTEEGEAKWAELVELFDFDDTDGTLHYDELVAGIKLLAMSEPVAAFRRMTSGPVKDWLFWMRETANAHISAMCARLVEFAGKGALDRVIKEQEEEEIVEAMHGRLISQIVINDATLEILEQLWYAMDKTGDGTISPRDFTQDAAMTEKWQEMASYFDADGDGEISWDEFTRGFINFARELPDPIVFPVIGATFTECVQHLQDTVNSRVVALCEQFYERFKHDQN